MDQLLHHVLRDRYQIQSLLGRKTGRRTFLVKDLETQSLVVIKLLLFGPDFTWEDLKLFEREAETLQSLDHSAIPKYLDSFELDTELGKGFALVQSYIEARSLQDWVQAGRTFSESELGAIATELLEILDYLHTRQPAVVHRDIKPSNILLGDRSGNSVGRVYLVDFGSVQTSGHGGTITVVGTYGYMPPEQFGGRASPASDLYGVGTTLIYLATGQHPGDLPQTDLRVEFESFTSLSRSFTRWIQRLTEPSLSKRLPSAKAALQGVQTPEFVEGVPLQRAPNSQASSNWLALSSRHPHFKIQLQTTPTELELVVPRNQIQLPSSSETITWERVLGASFGWSSFLLLAGVLIMLSLGKWIVLLMFLAVPFTIIRSILSSLSKEVESYTVSFCIENNSIFVAFYSSSSTDSIMLSKVKLQSISVEPAQLPKYQLNFNCHGSNTTFRIRGNRAEIQWLCDELNEWTGFEIRYVDPSP